MAEIEAAASAAAAASPAPLKMTVHCLTTSESMVGTGDAAYELQIPVFEAVTTPPTPDTLWANYTEPAFKAIGRPFEPGKKYVITITELEETSAST